MELFKSLKYSTETPKILLKTSTAKFLWAAQKKTATACKVMKLHASSWNCMLSLGTSYKLMELHASSGNCLQAHGPAYKHAFWNILESSACILECSACIMEHSGTFWNICIHYGKFCMHSGMFCMHSGPFWNILHAFWTVLEHTDEFWNILEQSGTFCMHSRTFWNIVFNLFLDIHTDRQDIRTCWAASLQLKNQMGWKLSFPCYFLSLCQPPWLLGISTELLGFEIKNPWWACV